jgi:hypothetical protein
MIETERSSSTSWRSIRIRGTKSAGSVRVTVAKVVSFFQAALRIKNRIAGVLQRNYPQAMNAMETMLAAVADTFDANALSALAEMRAPQEAAERMAYLAERANEGKRRKRCPA